MPVYKDEKRDTWFVRCYYTDIRGKKKQAFKRGFKLQRDAKQWETDFLKQIHGSSDMTFQALYEIFIKDMESRYKESTIEGYTNVFSLHILPYFGKRPISGITPKDIRAWQTELMGKGYSDAYLLRINNMIVSILNFAVSYYDLPSDPCHKAGSMGKRTTVVNFWTIEEYQKILSSVTDKTAHIMFQVFYYSGFRCGEFLALTLEDIDFEKNKISISKSLRRAGGKDIVTSPKTPKSVRTISMPGFVMDELREYVNSIYGLTDKDRIFPFTKSYINGCIRRACKATGIKRIRIHDLRHSHASYLIHLGCSPLLISERLGHEKVQTTLNTYSHLYPNKQQELVAMMESAHDKEQRKISKTA